MKKVILPFFILLFTLFALVSCNTDDELVKVSVNEVTHSVFYAPQYVAINKGFFEDEGLEIEFATGEGADKVMAAVLSGSVDIGFSGPEAAIYVYNEGREDQPMVFAQLTQRDGAFLVGREPQEDFKFTDLKGKHVLPGRRGGVPFMTFEYVLKENGLDTTNDLKFDDSIQFAMLAGAFTGGTGDYVALFEPVASTLEKEGRGHIVASIGEAGGDIPYTAYYANKSFIEENPDVIQKFTNAIYRAQQWIREAPAEEVAKAIQPSFPDTELDILTTVVERYISIDAWCATPVMNEPSFMRLQEIISTAGELDRKVPFEAVVDNSFAQNAVK
ncbi:MAG: ABC transporter substrate-binding protein [Ruminococcaceae bacterium]|nr:ABC transporter substrate-binding protein [Oscillospiraceae bacterium]